MPSENELRQQAKQLADSLLQAITKNQNALAAARRPHEQKMTSGSSASGVAWVIVKDAVDPVSSTADDKRFAAAAQALDKLPSKQALTILDQKVKEIFQPGMIHRHIVDEAEKIVEKQMAAKPRPAPH